MMNAVDLAAVLPATLTAANTPVGLSGEIISHSHIGQEFAWPPEDPRQARQTQREYTARDAERVAAASLSPHFDLAVFLEKTRQLDTPARILELLNHNAFQFNSRKRFREHPQWQARVAACCAQQQPVEILILAFCVISNPTKRLQPTQVTAAEDVSLLHMWRIAQHIQSFYPPGAVFHIISDSTFYALPLGVTSVEAQHYLLSLRERTQTLGIAGQVRIHDISDNLARRTALFHQRFEHWRSQFLDQPLSGEISHEEYLRWRASMRNTLNTKRMNLEYRDMVRLFGPTAQHAPTMLDEYAGLALAEYRALKAAAADTRWDEEDFPRAIRATIHAKKIPVLGLRLYPEYKLGSRLLPYHGMAVLTPADEAGRERMEIRHEITMIGNPAYTRVVDAQGLTQFYEPAGGQG